MFVRQDVLSVHCYWLVNNVQLLGFVQFVELTSTATYQLALLLELHSRNSYKYPPQRRRKL